MCKKPPSTPYPDSNTVDILGGVVVPEFQNRLPPRLIGCRSPGAEAPPLLIWAANFFRSSSLSSSEDGARGFDFLMGRTGDESVSDGGALVTLRLRTPPGRGDASSLDGVGDCMRISDCRFVPPAPDAGGCFESRVEVSSSGSVAEPESAACLIELGLREGATLFLFELAEVSWRSLMFINEAYRGLDVTRDPHLVRA